VIKVLRLSSDGLSAAQWHRRSIGFQRNPRIELLAPERKISDVVSRHMAALAERSVSPRWHFAKVGLEPGERRMVRFLLNRRDFAWYDVDSRDWVVTPGRFEIQAGGSSRDLPLTLTVDVQARRRTRKPLTRDSMIQEFRDRHNGEALYAELVRAMGFGELTRPSEPTPGLTAEQLAAKRKADSAMLAFVNEMPIYKIPAFSCGAFSEARLEEILREARE